MQPFSYVYNTQVHRKTIAPQYSLVLSRQPPGQSLLCPTLDKTPSAIDKDSTQLMRKLLQSRSVALRIRADASMQNSKSGCKLNYNRRVRDISFFVQGSYEYFDNKSLGTVSGASAETMAQHKYDKLKLSARGSY